MPFDCQICQPFIFDNIEDGNQKGFIHYIGIDRDLGHTLFVYVYLNFYSTGQDPEYAFAILKHDVYGGEKILIHDAKLTRGLFSPEERQMIMFVVVSATSKLLQTYRPSRVFRCTTAWNPSDKAMLKHHLVSWVFESVGYEVRPTDPFMGNRMWIAELKHDGCHSGAP